VEPSDAEEATYVSLYDGTVEGLDFPDLRARSVQFHPEAGPGPHDAWPILESWVKGLQER
jgi:carbamoyl-phosphate synthase small subunit